MYIATYVQYNMREEFKMRIPLTNKKKKNVGYWFLLDNINPIPSPLSFILRSSYSYTTNDELILKRHSAAKKDRVLSFLSSRPNWEPLTRRRECPPPLYLRVYSADYMNKAPLNWKRRDDQCCPNFFHPGSASKNLNIITQNIVSKLSE
jgi:hypothetical protein